MPDAIAWYDTLQAANEHALVVIAMQWPCWILSPTAEEPRFALAVQSEFARQAAREIHLYDEECAEEDNRTFRELPVFGAGRWLALIYAILLLSCFWYQSSYPDVGRSLLE